MTLLYMYFENTNSLDGKYKGIEPNPKGYRFDNRFNIIFDKAHKTFSITNNPNFVKIYNNAISNFSCIVGRNGSGKTTFIELLISNIAWGITERQPSMMKCIYYNIDDDGIIEFFLHQYIKWDDKYKIVYYANDFEHNTYGMNIKYSRNGYETNHPDFGKSFSSKLSDNTKFIFHSLSPFDKIFHSISIPFSKNPKRIKPFIEQMKYIGAQNIFKEDPKHEIQTITNLIRLFSSDFFKNPFQNTLGYKYNSLKINTDFKEIKNYNVDKRVIISSYIKEMSENIIEKVSTYQNIDKYPELIAFKNLSNENKTELFNFFLDDKTYENEVYSKFNKLYISSIIIDNFDFNKIESNILYFNNFLKLISFESSLNSNLTINIEQLRQNLLDITTFPKYTFIKDRNFLNNLINREEDINIILALSKLSIEEISKIKSLSDLIYFIRQLKNRDYLEFNLFLEKKESIVNFFHLSSGEKTMISYFANLSSAMVEFNNLENKTFIILIDEVELHLHPKWQLNFIEYMNTFFRSNQSNIKFQFIIATHSPFILSDIPEEQIIYINENEKQENVNDFNTFGANIYDIFEKGFFLDNSIGLCSQNFITQISDEFHYFKALHYALEYDDIFLLREYTKESYINYEKKKEEDEQLIKNKIIDLEKYITDYKYINFNERIVTLSPNSEKAINIIGEPTIKEHLLSLYSNMKDVTINANK